MCLKTADTSKIFRTQVFYKNLEKNWGIHSCDTCNHPHIESHNCADFSDIFIIVCMHTWFYQSIWTQLQRFFFLLYSLDKIVLKSDSILDQITNYLGQIVRMDPVACYWRLRWKSERMLTERNILSRTHEGKIYGICCWLYEKMARMRDGKDGCTLFMPHALEIKEKISITTLATGTTCSIPWNAEKMIIKRSIQNGYDNKYIWHTCVGLVFFFFSSLVWFCITVNCINYEIQADERVSGLYVLQNLWFQKVEMRNSIVLHYLLFNTVCIYLYKLLCSYISDSQV